MDFNPVKYMFELERFGIKLGLKTMQDILQTFNNPQNNFKSIHVAGTNGKGSTSNFIAGLLQNNGFKVGLYTSPHLKKFNERIKINNKEIADEEISNLVLEIKKASEENNIPLTFFEFTTTLAFLYFARNKVEYAVIEVGLGGRLDATNIITPLVSVITNINYDHQHILGEKLIQIAEEKAGIIKDKIPLITSEENQEILDLFKNICDKKNSRFVKIENYILIKKDLSGSEFIYKNKNYKISMLGEHQIKNACLAIEVLNHLNLDINNLENITFKGRLQFLEENILIDAAHNPDGIQKLVSFLKTLNKKIILVLALSKEKDIKKMTDEIIPLCKHIIITKGTFKPMQPEEIYSKLNFPSKEIIHSPKEALEKAKKLQKDEIILVTGSIYMIHDVL